MNESKVWFTSDWHLFHDSTTLDGAHKGIIQYSNRPFDTIDEMQETLTENYNSVVGKGDLVHFLGDFAFTNNTTDKDKVEKALSRLNGSKHLIIGNHDRKAVTQAKGWSWIGDYKSIKVKDPDGAGGNQKIVLFHYAIRTWQNIGRGAWHLYGHSHGNLPNAIGKSMDIGVDSWDYYPVSYQQVKLAMEAKTIFTEDHHKTQDEI